MAGGWPWSRAVFLLAGVAAVAMVATWGSWRQGPRELSQHRSPVFRGAAGRSQVDVVLAHYEEDLSWTRNFETPGVRFVVYSKGDQPPPTASKLPNIGREAHTFLHHIVHNYDRLAPWTVFSQASEPSWGFEGGNSKSGHLSDNVEFADYLTPYAEGQDSFFLFSAATHFPSGLQSGRVGMLFKGLRAESKEPCPVEGDEGWGPWWFAADHPHVTMANPSLLDFYHRYIALDENDQKPLTLAFPQGARFSVSRERIHKRPRAYYKQLLEQLSNGSNPIEGYWMETAWFDVFYPEALQSKTPLCSLPALPDGPALSPSEAYETVRRKLIATGDLSQDAVGTLGYSLKASSPGYYLPLKPGSS